MHRAIPRQPFSSLSRPKSLPLQLPPHPTTLSLATTIRSLLIKNQPKQALLHFTQWQTQSLTPDPFTIPSLLNLTLHLNQPSLHAQHLHALSLKSGYTSDIILSTALLKSYFNYGLFNATRQLFDEMPNRDVVFFTAMISGFSRNGLGDSALDIFSKMLDEGIKPNCITIASMFSTCSQMGKLALGKTLHGFSLRCSLFENWDVVLPTALLDMYAKCGSLGYTKKVFDRMSKRNLVSWNAIITANVLNGSFQVALMLFRDMVLEGWRWPRSSTLASVLKTCGVTTDLRKGKEIHGYVIKAMDDSSELEDSLVVGNAIIDMYMSTGSLESAVLVFERMPRRNMLTWTTMIFGYGSHGLSRKAIDVFNVMKESGISPDGVAFLSVLSACSHGGLVDEGRELYLSMQRDYSIVPEVTHFVCMVDLYGRAGLLRDAFEFIEAMPDEPSKFVWGALLSCCRTHKNVELGEYAAKKALDLDQHDVGNYVLLSRLYADTGRWEDVGKVRVIMKEMGLRPDTACSWVELKGRVYKFKVGDRGKKFSTKMYDFLEKLGSEMEKARFTSSAVDREKLRDLCCHTEKLALAFILVKDGGGGLIRIWKNLRVCRECHEAFKYVSMVCNRGIILKDPNLYHRFEQGCCSCQDYW